MSYYERYTRRTQRLGKTPKEKKSNEIKRNFLKHLEESPTAYEVYATRPDEVNITCNTRKIKCMINNITLNDQRVLDEKYIHVAWGEDIEIGCYIYWQNAHWLLMFMEHNTVESHRTFTMRRCNQILKYRYNDEVWDIPTSIENLTMYSDGLADNKMTSQPDSKRHLSFGSNPITRTIGLGIRIMIGHNSVFRVTHINDFEYNSAYTGSNGLIKALVLNASFIPEDDKESKVAYNEINDLSETKSFIVGEKNVTLGGKYKYSTSNEKDVKFELKLEENRYEYMKIIESDTKSCTIEVIKDSRFIGKKCTLSVYADGGRSESIEIKIVSI